MVTAIKPFMEDGKPQASLYKYDQLNRLTGMTTTRDYNVSANSWENALLSANYMTSYSYDANGNILNLQRNAVNTWDGIEMDDLEYFYYPGTNRLEYVTDAVHDTMYYSAKTGIEDIDNQQAGNYEYDRIGNLIKDRAEGIDTILWNVYGKVSKVLRDSLSDAPDLWFDYDAMGQRVRKTVSHGGFEFNRQYTYYARDAQGNVMATYKRNSEISGGYDSVISAITGWILEHDSLGIDSLIKLMQINFSDDANFKGLYIDELSFETLLMETIVKNLEAMDYLNLDSMLALAIMSNYPSVESLMENLLQFIYNSGFKKTLLVDPLMNCGSVVSFLEMLLTHDGSSAEFLNGLANLGGPLIENLHIHIFSSLPPPGPNRTQIMIDNLMDFGLPPKHSELDLAIAIDMLISTIAIEDVLQNSISASLYWNSMNPFHPFLPAYHFKNGYLVDLVNCADPEDVRDFWTDFTNYSQANYDLVEDILFGQTSLTYLLYLMSLHHPDMFIELSLQEAYSMLNNVLITMEEFSFEDYLVLIKNQFGANYAVEVYNEILKDFIYTERYILENLYLYGSNRLGMITPNQTIYERVFTINGIDSEGNYIIDEVLEADSAVVQDTLSQRILTKKQYELSNHLGNVLVTVSDRRNPIESQTTSGEIAYYEADISSAQDYYPFGMIMPGRHGGDTASFTICDTSYKDSVITKYSEDFSSGTGNWATGSVPFNVQWDGTNELMELEGDDDGSYAYLQFLSGNFESGVEYELTMDVKLDNSGQNIYIDVLEGTTSLISFYTVPYENGNYHPVEIQFTPASSTSVIEIRIYRMGAFGTEIIYVDNVLIIYKIPVVDTVVCEAFGYELAGGYRYGFNTQENVDELKGVKNHYTAPFWEYDPRVVHRWNQDPKQIIGISPYVINGNNPIYYTDPLGDFRTKFGAKVYAFFHGGEVSKATGGYREGEYFVGKQVEYTGEGMGVTYQRTFDSKLSTAAEYVRGGLGAALNFGKFLFGGGGHTTFREGDFEADMMATSPGVQKNIERYQNQLKSGKTVPFSYSFSPNPMSVLNDISNIENPFGKSISDENVEAHIDVFKTQSFTKLFVGGYVGKLRLINANTVLITITNATSANSFLLHGGEIIFGQENGAQRFNDLWNKTPFLNTQTQRFEFTVPLNKSKAYE